MARITLMYGQVEKLVVELLRVDAGQKTKLVARFKGLRRLGFPPGVNNKGGHFAYDLDASMKCVLAFSLMNSLFLPPQAVGLLEANWPLIGREIADVAASLAARDEAVDQAVRPPEGRYLVIAANALNHWAEPDGEAEVTASNRLAQPGTVMLLTGDQLAPTRGAEQSVAAPVPAARLTIDLWTTVAWVVGTIVAQGWADLADFGAPAVK